MKVYNQDKTQILTEYDLDNGYLQEDILITHIPEVKAVEEKGHYEVIAEYENGGKDVEWIIDEPGIEGKEAYDEKEEIQIYIPYTEEELRAKKIEKKISEKKMEILKYKNLLKETDYKAIKYAEGYYTDEEYESIKIIREGYRENIRNLEEQINSLTQDI